MLRIVLQGPGRLVAEAGERPVRGPGQALVRVHRVGVCGSDLAGFKGTMPFMSYPRVLGHELGVEVLEADADGPVTPGDLCAVEPYLNCGDCYACRRSRPNCCERLRVMGVHTDGGMQGLVTVPIDKLHPSRRLSLEQLALVETLGIGAHAVARSRLQPGEQALVVGAGPIGLSVVQFAQAAGASVQVLEISPARRALASRFRVEAVAETHGRRFEVVFDATGNADAMEQSFQHVAHGGRLVFVGIVQGRISFEDKLFHAREIALLASRNSCGEFPSIIRMIEDGRIDTTPWITHRLGLEQVPGRFAELYGQQGLLKAMIEVPDEAV